MSEVLTQRENIGLTDEDQSWLAGFGVDPTWQDDPKARNHLNDLIELGSMRLDEPINQVNRSAIIDARTMFMHFVGVEQDTLDVFLHQNPTIIPLDTFTATQRTIFELGLDAVKIINTFPGTISLAPESVREKVANLSDLGLDAVKIINAFPSAIGLAPESVREKVVNLEALGLDAVKIINAFPSAIGLAKESVREKFANLSDLGLDAVKIINTFPGTIKFAPESVREKVANLSDLGLDAVKIINTLPQAFSYAPESVLKKFANLSNLGLNAIKIINTSPSAIGLAPESVREKFANLSDLGLDAVQIINTFPGTIKFAPESVREKVRFLNRSIDVLRWEHTAVELINFYPALLSFSTKKLAVLRRIAGTHINEASRSAEPKVVASALIVPLEKYILELSKAGDTDLYEQTAIIPSVEELAKTARRHNLNVANRREQALQAVMDGSGLGKIATMYLAYRKISSF